MSSQITIEWGDGYAAIYPEFPERLTKELQYWHRTFERKGGQNVTTGQYRQLYNIEPYVNGTEYGRTLLIMPGFISRARNILREEGYDVRIVDKRTPAPKPDIANAMKGLRDYQLPCAYTMVMSGGGVIACPTGWGKCLSPSTPILYADGTVKPISEVKVGDLLIGDDSTPRKVLERIDGFGPMYRITPLTGRTIEVADHHILSLVKSGDCKRDKYPDGHTVAITVEDYLKQSKTFKHRHKLYRVPVEFATQPVTIEPYWLGIWLGDGDWNRPMITTADAEVVSAIQTYAMQLGLSVNNTGTRDSHRTPSYSIVKSPGQDNVLLQRMRSYGLLKSKVKRIPREFLINSREIRLQLLAGLMDSDGSLNEGTDFDFVGTNQALVTDVEFLARTLGFRVHASKRKCTGFGLTVDAWRLRISGATHLIPTKIKRKQAKVRKQVKDGLRTGFKVERIADGPYVGVKLDGNMLHLLDDCTVLHNTHLMGAVINAFSHEELCARNTPTIVVTTPDKDITFKDYQDLIEICPDRDIGIAMSGMKKKYSDDIQVITLDSLHLLNPDDVGILIVDEVHTAASESRSDIIASFRKSLRWGVSATPDGRFDGRDKVTEGLFGPIIYSRTYKQGISDGALVPIKIYWINAPEPSIGLNNYLAYKTHAGKYRHGVDLNENQNKLIAEVLKKTPDKLQTLCIMRHLQQMDRLVPMAEGVKYVHGQESDDTIAKECYHNLTAISKQDRRAIYADVADGTTRKIMSTYVYKQGVNFPNLTVIVNAGGSGSEIVATQIPGRESRLIANKTEAYLVDFWHAWDMEEKDGRSKPGPVHRDDRAREACYTELGFDQVWITSLDELPFLKNVDG